MDFHSGPIKVLAFQQLKDTFTSIPILKHFELGLEVIIEMNASNFAIGYILFQKQVG
jgi:hypothetical protein